MEAGSNSASHHQGGGGGWVRAPRSAVPPAVSPLAEEHHALSHSVGPHRHVGGKLAAGGGGTDSRGIRKSAPASRWVPMYGITKERAAIDDLSVPNPTEDVRPVEGDGGDVGANALPCSEGERRAEAEDSGFVAASASGGADSDDGSPALLMANSSAPPVAPSWPLSLLHLIPEEELGGGGGVGGGSPAPISLLPPVGTSAGGGGGSGASKMAAGPPPSDIAAVLGHIAKGQAIGPLGTCCTTHAVVPK